MQENLDGYRLQEVLLDGSPPLPPAKTNPFPLVKDDHHDAQHIGPWLLVQGGKGVVRLRENVGDVVS
jgi:hypothetical protein